MCRLILPTNKYRDQYIEGIKELLKESSCPTHRKHEIDHFDVYLQETKNARRGKTVGTSRTEYWLMSRENYVGKIQIRHIPSGRYLNLKSHIYYEIRPSFRNKALGNRILGLGLIKARTIGIKTLIIICKENNLASKKIIENNGGVLVGKEKTPEGVFLKYNIKII